MNHSAQVIAVTWRTPCCFGKTSLAGVTLFTSFDAMPQAVMQEFPDIVIAYGESDEYSFVLRKSSVLYSEQQKPLLCVR